MIRYNATLGAVVAMAAGCDRVLGLEAPRDAALGLGAWSEPVPIGLVGDDPSVSKDLRELFFQPLGMADVYVSRRADTRLQWPAGSVVGDLSTPFEESSPELSPDGLSIYFSNSTPGVTAGFDIWRAARPELMTDTWDTPIRISDLNSNKSDFPGGVDTDELAIVVSSTRIGDTGDIYLSRRSTSTMPWGMPAPIGGSINTPSDDQSAFLSADGLTLLFGSTRGGNLDLYLSRRAQIEGSFVDVIALDEVNSGANDDDPWMSEDGRHLYFASDRSGMLEIWYSTR